MPASPLMSSEPIAPASPANPIMLMSAESACALNVVAARPVNVTAPPVLKTSTRFIVLSAMSMAWVDVPANRSVPLPPESVMPDTNVSVSETMSALTPSVSVPVYPVHFTDPISWLVVRVIFTLPEAASKIAVSPAPGGELPAAPPLAFDHPSEDDHAAVATA